MKRMLFNATHAEELRVAIVEGQKLIDIDLSDIQSLYCLVHLDQRQKITDNVIFPINLLCDISHKFLIQLNRHIFLGKQGICQHFHGCQRCL